MSILRKIIKEEVRKSLTEAATPQEIKKLKDFFYRAQKIEADLEKLEMDMDDYDSDVLSEMDSELTQRQLDWFQGMRDCVEYARSEITDEKGGFALYNKALPFK